MGDEGIPEPVFPSLFKKARYVITNARERQSMCFSPVLALPRLWQKILNFTSFKNRSVQLTRIIHSAVGQRQPTSFKQKEILTFLQC